jgi:hypothetical protein
LPPDVPLAFPECSFLSAPVPGWPFTGGNVCASAGIATLTTFDLSLPAFVSVLVAVT